MELKNKRFLHDDVWINIDFEPEKKRIYTVRVVAYGLKGKRRLKVSKKHPQTVFVIDHLDHFINRMTKRLDMAAIGEIEIYYIRQNGLTISH